MAAAAASSSLPPPSASTAPRNSPRPHPPPHCAATKTPPLHRPGGAPGFSARAGPRCVLGSLSALRSLGRRWRRRRFRNYASRRAPRQRGNPEAERGRRGARGPAVELARVFPGDGGSEAPPWRVGAALLPPPPSRAPDLPWDPPSSRSCLTLAASSSSSSSWWADRLPAAAFFPSPPRGEGASAWPRAA